MEKRNSIVAFMATASPVGGVATWLDHFQEACDAAGHRLTVALVQGQRENDPRQFKRFHPHLNSVIVDGRGFNRESRIRACQRMIRKHDANIVLPLGVLDANAAAIREKRRRPLYLIARAQGNLPPMLADLQDLRDGIDHVVCVGEMTRQYLVQVCDFDTQRVSHIPNGARLATHTQQKRNSGILRLGYVGRLSKGDKRVMDIPPLCLELSNRNIDFRLIIVGTGQAESELREQFRPFHDRVKLIGAKSSDEIYRDVLPNLDMLLLFSSSETFGIVLAEAMMNGVVPVTSRYIGFQSERLVVDGKHGRSFPVGDVAQAAEIVSELNQDSEQLDRLSKNARDHAIKNYTWARCQQSWSDLINSILKRTPITPPKDLCRPIRANHGTLDRLSIPHATVDWIRRLRRATLGMNQIDGQEWPLFHRDHPQSRLEEIADKCLKLEADQECQNS